MARRKQKWKIKFYTSGEQVGDSWLGSGWCVYQGRSPKTAELKFSADTEAGAKWLASVLERWLAGE